MPRPMGRALVPVVFSLVCLLALPLSAVAEEKHVRGLLVYESSFDITLWTPDGTTMSLPVDKSTKSIGPKSPQGSVADVWFDTKHVNKIVRYPTVREDVLVLAVSAGYVSILRKSGQEATLKIEELAQFPASWEWHVRTLISYDGPQGETAIKTGDPSSDPEPKTVTGFVFQAKSESLVIQEDGQKTTMFLMVLEKTKKVGDITAAKRVEVQYCEGFLIPPIALQIKQIPSELQTVTGTLQSWSSAGFSLKDPAGKIRQFLLFPQSQVVGDPKVSASAVVQYFVGAQEPFFALSVATESGAALAQKKTTGVLLKLTDTEATLRSPGSGQHVQLKIDPATKIVGSVQVGDLVDAWYGAGTGSPVAKLVQACAAEHEQVKGHVLWSSGAAFAVADAGGKEVPLVMDTALCVPKKLARWDLVSVAYLQHGPVAPPFLAESVDVVTSAQGVKLQGVLAKWSKEKFDVTGERGQTWHFVTDADTKMTGDLKVGAAVLVLGYEAGERLATSVAVVTPPAVPAKKVTGTVKAYSYNSLTLIVGRSTLDFKIDNQTKFDGRLGNGREVEVTYQDVSGRPATLVRVLR